MQTTEEQIMTSLMSQPLSRTVEETSGLLKRWYILERGCLRAIAGWLPAVENQEMKLLLARHLWLTATAANALRERILELRYPRRDVDRDWDAQLCNLIQSATNAPNERAFVAGLYDVIRPTLLEAYRAGITRSERVGDGPTIVLLDRLIATTQRQLDEMKPLMATPGSGGETNRWQRYLGSQLDAAGGVDGQGDRRDQPVDTALERPFERPTIARRDPRYQRHAEMMCHHFLFWAPDHPDLAWLCHAIGHFNELWAAEASATLIYQHPDAPWNLVFDATRWSYDEARHCQMGITRLERAGIDIFKDVPAPDSATYNCFEPDRLKERMLAIHCFERGGVVGGTKQRLMKWHEQVGDRQGAQHFDFDWADESIHLRYGIEWLKHLYGEGILDAKLEDRMMQAVKVRLDYFRPLVPQQEPLVESYFRDLAAKLNIPYQTKPSEFTWEMANDAVSSPATK